MSIDRGTWEYLLATVLGIGTAALIYLSLEESTATECYRDSLGISIEHSGDMLAGCPESPFNAVRAQIADQRAKLAADETFDPAEPDPVAGRSMLVVWISLFVATAGVAGLSWVRSLFTIVFDIRPVWQLSVWSMLWSFVVTFGVLLVPYILLTAVGDSKPEPVR